MPPKSVFITGANRGIGLEFIKQFLKLKPPPDHIFATYREVKDSTELHELARSEPSLRLLQLDVCDYEKYSEVVREVEGILEGQGLNLLINNAGTISRDSLETVTVENMRKCLECNTIAPVMLTQAFLSMLKTAAKQSPESGMSWSKSAVINITSKVGSCDDNKSGGRYPYRISKAGINMATVNMAVDLKDCGILAAVLHPGWVLTDMGGKNALIGVEECVAGMINVMTNLNHETTGSFTDYKGCNILW